MIVLLWGDGSGLSVLPVHPGRLIVLSVLVSSLYDARTLARASSEVEKERSVAVDFSRALAGVRRDVHGELPVRRVELPTRVVDGPAALKAADDKGRVAVVQTGRAEQQRGEVDKRHSVVDLHDTSPDVAPEVDGAAHGGGVRRVLVEVPPEEVDVVDVVANSGLIL